MSNLAKVSLRSANFQRKDDNHQRELGMLGVKKTHTYELIDTTWAVKLEADFLLLLTADTCGFSKANARKPTVLSARTCRLDSRWGCVPPHGVVRFN